MIKNATLYRVDPTFRFDHELLRRRAFVPCSAMQQSSDGFVEPCAHSTSGLIHHIPGSQIICWQTEDKILPGSVVAEAVAERAQEIEDKMGYKPGRKQLREIKEAVIAELLPKAFVQRRRTLCVLRNGYLIIDTSSVARADGVISCLKDSINQMGMVVPATKFSPASQCAQWMMNGEASSDLIQLGSEAIIEQRSEDQPQIKYVRTDITSSDVVDRLAEGWAPTKIALIFNDQISFTLSTSNLQLSKLSLLDIVREESPESDEEQFDADVELMSGLIVMVANNLAKEFGGYATRNDLLTESNQS